MGAVTSQTGVFQRRQRASEGHSSMLRQFIQAVLTLFPFAGLRQGGRCEAGPLLGDTARDAIEATAGQQSRLPREAHGST